MFEDPVRAGCGGAKTHRDAVAGGLHLGEVDVDFGYDTGHVDALVICFSAELLGDMSWMRGMGKERRTTNAAAAEAVGDHQAGELLGSYFALADCAFEAGISVFEDVEVVVHVIVWLVAGSDGVGQSGRADDEDGS